MEIKTTISRFYNQFYNWLNEKININFIKIAFKIIVVVLFLDIGYSLINSDSNFNVGIGIGIFVLVLSWIVAQISDLIF